MEPTEIVRAYWSAVWSRDWDAMGRTLAEDVEIFWPVTGRSSAAARTWWP